jgi:hypothetical protein
MTETPHLTLVTDEKKTRRGRRPRAPKRHEGAIEELRKQFFARIAKAAQLRMEAEAIEVSIHLLARTD